MFKRSIGLFVLSLLIASPALGQSGVAVSLRNGTTDPAKCQPRSTNVFINRTSSAVLKVCTATDTWTGLASLAGGAFTGPVLLPDGTAAAPSLGFSSDSDGTGTGLFRSAANSIGFATNGVERMIINASGSLVPLIDNTYDLGNGSVDFRDANFARNLSAEGSINASAGNLQLSGQRFQHFVLTIANNAGTIQHKIESWVGDAATGNLNSQIVGASATYANTPTLGAGTDFTAGGGIISNSFFVLNNAAQTDGDTAGVCTVVSYTGGGALVVPVVHWRETNTNVNGVTQRRIGLSFGNSSNAGGAWNINTTNLPSGTAVIVQCFGLIK